MSGKAKAKPKPKAAPLSEPVLAGKTVAEKVALVRGELNIMLDLAKVSCNYLCFWLCAICRRRSQEGISSPGSCEA